MSWSVVKVGDVCTLMTGGTPKTKFPEYYEGGNIPWIVSGDIHKGEIFDCEKRITALAVDNSNARYLPKNSVLIALNGQGKTRGTVALLRIENATCNQSIVSINPNRDDELFSDYLFYYLKSIYQQIRNITGDKDRAGLNMPLIREIEIPLPPLAEQQRIAAILDKADALRRKRQQAIDLADQFLRSVFLEMFGDPVTNPKGWPLRSLSSLVQKPITYGILKPEEFVENGIPMLRIQDLKGGSIGEQGLHRVSERLSHQYKRTVLQGGEIVISLVGTLGLSAVVPVSLAGANVHRNLGVISIQDNEVKSYLSSLMRMPQFEVFVDRVTKGGVHKLLNLAELNEMEVPLPRIEQISKFLEIERVVKSSVSRHASSSEGIKTMFSSLSQQAFRGEL